MELNSLILIMALFLKKTKSLVWGYHSQDFFIKKIHPFVQILFIFSVIINFSSSPLFAQPQPTKKQVAELNIIEKPQQNDPFQAAAKSQTTSFLQTLQPHKPSFFLTSWFLQDGGNDRGYRNEELIVQFSFKKHLLHVLYFGYTQKFFWQLYDYDNSNPIRETNYNPEFFLDFPDTAGFENLRLGVWEHESNGQKEEHDENGREINRSRTWNRYYLQLKRKFRSGWSGLNFKLWGIYDRQDGDYGSFYEDNKDIQHFLGCSELTFLLGNESPRVSAMFRRGWGKGTETVRLTGRAPLYPLLGLADNGVDLFFYYFSGYGESLIDYNRKSNRVGIGFSIR